MFDGGGTVVGGPRPYERRGQMEASSDESADIGCEAMKGVGLVEL